MSLEYQLKAEKDKLTKKDKEVEKIKAERVKAEATAKTLEADLEVSENFLTIEMKVKCRLLT